MQNLFLKTKKTPFFNQLIKLRANFQNKTKLLKFKKKKWKLTKNAYAKKFKWYQKYKVNDQSMYLAVKYAISGNKYLHYFRNSNVHKKNLQLFYGILSKRKFKNQLKYLKKKKKFKLHTLELIKFFESRLDSVIFRAKFSKSIQDAQQLILHGKILVNKKIIKSISYFLKPWDIISVENFNHYLIVNNLKYYYKNWKFNKTSIWPHPSKHLLINYTTFEILFGVVNFHSASLGFFYYLNLDKIINKSYYN